MVQHKTMNSRKHTKLVHEGKYVAEVNVEIIDSENSWSPYLSLDDALKLDQVRTFLRNGEIDKAKALAKVYILKPVAA
jgi:hypothetical protein